MTTNRTPIAIGQRVAQTAGAEVDVFVPGHGGRMPTHARIYAVEYIADAKMDHFPSKWDARANTDSDIVMHGVIRDPNAPDEDQGKPVEIEIGVCGTYAEQLGTLAGKPRVQEFYQLLIALGEKTQAQADQEIAAGTPIDASQWIAGFKQKVAAAGGKFTLPTYYRFRTTYFKPRNAGDQGEVGTSGDWTRVTSMAHYQAQIEAGAHTGTSRTEFEEKNAAAIEKLKMKHGITDNKTASGGGMQATAPAMGMGGVQAPMIPNGGMQAAGMGQGMTTAQAFMGGQVGVPPTS